MNHDRPHLPVRVPANRAIAATLQLWRRGECTDPAVLARVATGLRALPGQPQHTPSGNTHFGERHGSPGDSPTSLGDIRHRHAPTAQDNR